jgi:uncharacterized protein
MPVSAYLSLLLLGLLGAAHCGAMCGGFVAALSRQSSQGAHPLFTQLAYSAGRIFSYVAAGALAGTFAGMAMRWFDMHAAQLALYVLANLLLVAVGISLAGLGTPAAWLERLGAKLWRVLQPLTRFVFPATTVPRALGAGLLWGWLPCGLVYSALGVALLSANARDGAGLMLAFGIGTLPAILGVGFLSTRLISHQSVRQICGAVIIAFGVSGLVHASGLLGPDVGGILCRL